MAEHTLASMRAILEARKDALGLKAATLDAIIGECARNPKLLGCAPQSLLSAAVQHQTHGLQFGGECWLLPRWSKGGDVAQWQIGYKGLVARVAEEPRVTRVECGFVYENEIDDPERFAYDAGAATLKHRPILRSSQRGELAGIYALIEWRGALHIRWMDIDELCDWRDRHCADSAYKRGSDKTPENLIGPWRDHPEAMMAKTVMTRCAKDLPFGSRISALVTPDAADVEIDPRHAAAEAAGLTEPPTNRDPLAGALPAPAAFALTPSPPTERQPGEDG